ncbi:uncharacterized protein ACBR49_017068 [Aulostomus maculatus]
MDGLETPYEDDASNDFIECTVCDKSIRGKTLYKIHLTTPGHIKKEDAVVALGLGVREHTVPVFEDISHYLAYLNLDEPIIGLNFLEEIPSDPSDPQAGPRYTCVMCNLTANLPEIVHHVIGRKHRLKYVESKRPDLVTWDKDSVMSQRTGGKIIRARAEIIERQDGRGCPRPLKNKGVMGKLNISRVPQRHNQNGSKNLPQSLIQMDFPPHPPQLQNYPDEFSHRGRYPNPPFHSNDPHMIRADRPDQPRGGKFTYNHMDEERRRPEESYRDPDYRTEYKDQYVRDPESRDGLPRYDSREGVPHGPSEAYPVEAPLLRRPYPEKDVLKEFYDEEVRRGRIRTVELEPPQPSCQEHGEQWWPIGREPNRPTSGNLAGRQGPKEPEAKRKTIPSLLEIGQPHERFIIRDYGHEIKQPHQADPGPSRKGPTPFLTPSEVSRKMMDIPEPFRRFLKGGAAADEMGHGKRKRKSRFSDATAEEMETANKMFSDECEPPNPKYGGHLRPGSIPFEPEIYRHSYPYTESQSSHYADSYQRDSEEGGVFDMLKNIEIENIEEADFLKNKLCNLLREFKAKKAARSVQNNQGCTVNSKECNSSKPDLRLSPPHRYETTLREDSDIRRPEEAYFEQDRSGRGWKQQDVMHQEYRQTARVEPRHTNRSRYEEVFGSPDLFLTPHTPHPQHRPSLPERFQENVEPCAYQPPSVVGFDSHSPAPFLDVDRRPRMNRGPQYSSSLDKITSTLLELVARK